MLKKLAAAVIIPSSRKKENLNLEYFFLFIDIFLATAKFSTGFVESKELFTVKKLVLTKMPLILSLANVLRLNIKKQEKFRVKRNL